MEIEDLVMNFVHEKFGLRGDEDPATPRGGPERALHGLEALLREQTALSQSSTIGASKDGPMSALASMSMPSL